MIKPIKHIKPSPKDKNQLEQILGQKQPVQAGQPETYRDRVVVKPWGHEFLVFENENVAIWYLSIRKDHSTSMHCHPVKKTSLTVLSGRALCNTFHHRNFLSAGDSLIIEPAVFHSTKAMSLDGISLLEVETPPDKVDLVRLEDKYGREGSGYEGSSQMVMKELDNFNFFNFEEEDCHGKKMIFSNRFVIAMEIYEPEDGRQTSFEPEPGALYCVCRGRLLTRKGETALGLGETERGAYLKDIQEGISFDEKITLMKFFVFE